MQRNVKRNISQVMHRVSNKPAVTKSIHSRILNKYHMRKNSVTYQDTKNSSLHHPVDSSLINQPRVQQRPPWSYQTPQTVNPQLTHYTHKFHQSLPSNMPNPSNSRTFDFPRTPLWQNVSGYPSSQSLPTQFLSRQCVTNQFGSNQCVPNNFAENMCHSVNIYNGVQSSPPQFFSQPTIEHQNPDPFQQSAPTFTHRFDN
jgi:hypothetical protein